MKRFIIYSFCLLAIGLALVSCSQDDESPISNITSIDAISFNVGTDNYKTTRATPITASNYNSLMNSFAVTAVTDTANLGSPSFDNYYIGSLSTPSVFTNEHNGLWAGETYYWPADTATKLSFYAISPALDNYELVGFGVTRQDFIRLEAATDPAKQVDYMSAYVPAITRNTSNGSVNLQFKHIMSQIRFAVDLSTIKEGYQISIDSIKLYNILNSCTYRISRHEVWPKNGWTAPKILGERKRSTFIAPVNPVENLSRSRGRVVLTPDDGALLLPPQMFQWSTNYDSISTKPKDKYQCIEITCKIYNTANKQYVVGSETEYGKIYIRLARVGYNEDNDQDTGAYNDDTKAPIWRSGRCYTYVLKFDGSDGFGTDEDGKSHNIHFNVDVEDWKEPSTNLNF